MNRRRALQAFLLCSLLGGRAFATGQIPEEIHFDGRSEMLFSEPLNYYLVEPKNLARLQPYLGEEHCSGSWRRFRGIWEIRDFRLHLLQLEANPCSEKPTPVPLTVIFYESGPVFASWYTGTLVVPTGRRLSFVNMGYQSQYERYIVFTVVQGRVTGRSESSVQPK